MKAKRFLVCDTETTGLGNRAYVFDIAYAITTRKKTILERQYIVRDVITNPARMLSALGSGQWTAMFGGKLFDYYIPAIAAKPHRVKYWSDIVNQLRADIREYQVDVFAAYNLDFDMRAIANTQRALGFGKVLESRPDLLCLWRFACGIVARSRAYHNAARQFGWISDAGNVRTNAEKVYAYLSGDFSFIESHTALADARIEAEILRRMLARKRTIPYNVRDHMPWKMAQHI